MAVNEGLVEAIDRLVEDWQGVGRRRMFGGMCYMASGRMFLGALDELVFFKVPEVDRQTCLEEAGMRPASIHGSVFGRWVEWTWDGSGEVKHVSRWVRASYEIASVSQAESQKGVSKSRRIRRL